MANYDWKEINEKLTLYLRLEETPIGLKWFKSREECLEIPRIRVQKKHFSICQMIWQSITFGWTLAILPENIGVNYCQQVNGLRDLDEGFHSGNMFKGVWFENQDAAKSHHQSLVIPDEKHEAIGVSPLKAGKFEKPDVCVFYLNTAQAFMFLSALIYKEFQKLEFAFIGETACSNLWMKTFVEKKVGAGIPSFGERKFGACKSNQICVTVTPDELVTVVENLEALHKNGLRYPIPPLSLTVDADEGFPKHYFDY
ncbi:MAG: DUF169 domain-containing protein [Tissierellia bacterium]|nr:DUF169 domain-containing protein [Tissierellia bacterium]